jgi:glucose-6-phosphate 1-dehydrogenase
MTDRRDSDAIVLFGVTGDLCYRKIFPSLYELVKRGLLRVPVIGVARAGWKQEQLVEHVRKSMQEFVPQADEEVVARLVSLLKYVDGDYKERSTFDSLKKALGNPAERLPHGGRAPR